MKVAYLSGWLGIVAWFTACAVQRSPEANAPAASASSTAAAEERAATPESPVAVPAPAPAAAPQGLDAEKSKSAQKDTEFASLDAAERALNQAKADLDRLALAEPSASVGPNAAADRAAEKKESKAGRAPSTAGAAAPSKSNGWCEGRAARSLRCRAQPARCVASPAATARIAAARSTCWLMPNSASRAAPARPRATEMNPPVGRLAPSPTGLLHLGHARTFLLAFWHIRSRAGRLLLRMEDLDGPRAEMRFADAALADLEWLGLTWDGAPLLQSSELPRLNAAVAALIEAGKAYPCVCSRGDIRGAQSAPHAGSLEPRYPGTCRGRYTSFAEAERRSGQAAGARLLVPEGSISIRDGVSGISAWDVARDVGDFLIAKRDKAPAYQLAVVVDDHAQGVTEVLRGDDLLPSAARQWHVQNALGLPHPAWFHVPLVTDGSGRRLAKREADLSLAELRAGGTDPRAIVAWAAQSAGLALSERVTPAEVTPLFQLAALPTAPVPLGAEQLAALKAAR